MNGIVTIMGRIVNLTCSNILWKITITTFLFKIPVLFKMVILVPKANVNEIY